MKLFILHMNWRLMTRRIATAMAVRFSVAYNLQENRGTRNYQVSRKNWGTKFKMRRENFRWFFLTMAMALSAPAQADLTFTSAPRDSAEKEEQIYQPVVDLLTKATGQRVRFLHGGNYLVYQSEMRKGTYDIVFDGPHFLSWRMAKLQHVPLVKFPGNLEFVVAVKKDQAKVNSLKDMGGRTMCAFPPPNLATLAVQFEFDNPTRQPMLLETETFPQSYKNMVAGKCVGAILHKKLFENLDKDAQVAKVIFTSKPYPNQAFSVGPKVTPEMRERIVKALLSPEGAVATQKMRDVYKAQSLVPATAEEFQGLGQLLRDVWGFGL